MIRHWRLRLEAGGIVRGCSAVKANPKLNALIVVLAATVAAAGELPTWHLKSGSSVEAEIVAFPGPDTVEVKRSDGKVYTMPCAYLEEADLAYLAAERAKQWKEVSIDKLLDPAPTGRYWKCAVTGKSVPTTIMVALLPRQVEAVLKSRQQQDAQITNLNTRIQNDSKLARDANAAAARSGRAYRKADKAEAKLASSDETATKANLTKLKADYAANLKKTKTVTPLKMKNTGMKCEGLPVWECQVARTQQ
jgi:hypothetical protein